MVLCVSSARPSIIATVHPPVEYQPDNGAMYSYGQHAQCKNQRETKTKVGGGSDTFLFSLDPNVTLPQRWRTLSPTG